MPKLRRVAKLAATKSASGPSLWLSRDPIGENGGINLYGYVDNDPVNGVDSLGLLTDEQANAIVKNTTIVGGAVGALLGGIAGGTGGTLIGAPTGPGAILTGAAGATAGAIEGGAIGATGGAAIATGIIAIAKWWDQIDPDDDTCPSGGTEKMPQGNNKFFKKQFEEALRQLDIAKNSDKARRLHDLITKQGLKTVDEIVAAGQGL